jgi:P-aminobenzoate N-oxygenase AurF
MLTTATVASRRSTLQRLAAAPVRPREGDIDWKTPIDRSRWFFCETLTPLYYAPIYRDLDLEHRRRYNQLTAMMANEIIAFMESEFLVATLTAVSSDLDINDSGDLRAAVIRFAEDERRHAGIWWNLNRLSEPAWYCSTRWRLIKITRGVLSAARFVARHPVAFPLVFWLQLAQEERSLEISRRCMRLPASSIEPRYLAAYGAHLPDEGRHVQIDRHLIERYYRRRRPLVRQSSASLFRTIVRTLLVTPVHSTARVVRILAAEYPELAPLVSEILCQLKALGCSTEYHEMMYSRSTTPVTFALFDEHPEFHAMREVLLAYEPHRGSAPRRCETSRERGEASQATGASRRSDSRQSVRRSPRGAAPRSE